MTTRVEALSPGDGLLLVDVQRCFLPGGDLPVAQGDQVVPVLNRWLAAAGAKGIPIYASRDWHPPRHPSFQTEGGPWPPHCIEESDTADFPPELRLPAGTVVITKGVRFDRDQNSAFNETGFHEQLRRDGVSRLWIGGLALDVCVLATALDARRLGLAVRLLVDGCRPVGRQEGERALIRLREAGVELVREEQFSG